MNKFCFTRTETQDYCWDINPIELDKKIVKLIESFAEIHAKKALGIDIHSFAFFCLDGLRCFIDAELTDAEDNFGRKIYSVTLYTLSCASDREDLIHKLGVATEPKGESNALESDIKSLRWNHEGFLYLKKHFHWLASNNIYFYFGSISDLSESEMVFFDLKAVSGECCLTPKVRDVIYRHSAPQNTIQIPMQMTGEAPQERNTNPIARFFNLFKIHFYKRRNNSDAAINSRFYILEREVYGQIKIYRYNKGAFEPIIIRDGDSDLIAKIIDEYFHD